MGLIDFSAFLDDLASHSGKAILPFFRTAMSVQDKSAREPAGRGGFDPVTEADRASESIMRQLIKRHFPTHGIVGEEFGDENVDAEYVWVLDPIDGTRAFMSGLPLWGTLIGLMRHGKPAFGMMHQPFTGERFSGDNRAAKYTGPGGERKLRTRRCATLAEATLSTTSPRLFKGDALAAFERVEEAARLTRFGYDCYAYCMLAAGHMDLVIEDGLKPYDIVALIPIIEGAGGIVTSWDGGDASKGGTILAAGDRRVHEEAMALLARR
jgi:histidinol phosphatase-like enzyme (inositol monophosphatase family)